MWETCWKSTTISALLLFFTPHAQNREDIIFHHLIYSCFPALSLRATVSISPVWNKHKWNLTQLESPYRPEAFDPFTRKPGAWKAYTCRSGGGSAVKEGFVLDRERERERDALGQDRRAHGTSAHRPGQGAAKMEIRPDRFKAVAGKTLGKIHRYTDISNVLNSPRICARFYAFFLATHISAVGGGAVGASVISLSSKQ